MLVGFFLFCCMICVQVVVDYVQVEQYQQDEGDLVVLVGDELVGGLVKQLVDQRGDGFDYVEDYFGVQCF